MLQNSVEKMRTSTKKTFATFWAKKEDGGLLQIIKLGPVQTCASAEHEITCTLPITAVNLTENEPPKYPYRNKKFAC